MCSTRLRKQLTISPINILPSPRSDDILHNLLLHDLPLINASFVDDRDKRAGAADMAVGAFGVVVGGVRTGYC